MSELQRITDIRESAERAAEAGYDVNTNPHPLATEPSEHRLWRHYFFMHKTQLLQQEAA
jgi:hypothetical protein